MQYDVNLYAVVLVKVQGVEAGSQVEAIQLARDHAPLHDLLRNKGDWPVPGLAGARIPYTEFADGLNMFYLVDEAEDPEYLRSNYYHEGPGGPTLGGPWDKEEADANS